MEKCIVCLESNEDIFSRINTLSREWIAGNMQKIIEKHLWWWYLKPPSSNNNLGQWICRLCWQEISAFHKFYSKVHKANRNYQPIVSFLNKIYKNDQPRKYRNKPLIDKKGLNTIDVKTEVSFSSEYDTNQYYNVITSPSHFRGDGHNISNVMTTGEVGNMANIEGEIDIGDIKTQFSLSECDTNEEYISAVPLNGDAYDNASYLQNDRRNYTEMTIEEYENKSKFGEDGTTLASVETGITFDSNEFHTTEIHSSAISIREDGYVNSLYFKEMEVNGISCNEEEIDESKLRKNKFNVINLQGKTIKNKGIKNEYTKNTDDFLKQSLHKLKCCICSEPFLEFHSLTMHYRTEHNTPGYAMCCGIKYFKSCKLIDHLRLHESSNFFKCQLCSKIFKSLRQLDQHTVSHRHSSLLHHTEKRSGRTLKTETCDICGLKLATRINLAKHKEKIHSKKNQGEQICPYCSRVSPNLNSHRSHIKYSHTMKRKHACHLCDKAFKRPLELKEHLCTHTGEALYTCSYCPRKFVSNSNMYKHRKAVHYKEWEENRLKKLNNNGGDKALPYTKNLIN